MKDPNWDFAKGNNAVPFIMEGVNTEAMVIDPELLPLIPQLRKVVAECLMNGLKSNDIFPLIKATNLYLRDEFAEQEPPRIPPLNVYLHSYILLEMWLKEVFEKLSGAKVKHIRSGRTAITTTCGYYVESMVALYDDLESGSITTG